MRSALYRAISKGIPDNDFGLCPGKTQPGNSTPGLSDWLADMIDEIAGRDPKKDPPLTFGDLSPADADTGGHKITLRMMTTNLTLRRPYSLPFTEANEKIYAFRLADFERLFPARITSYLTAHCEKVDDPTGEYGDLYKFPEPENLPLIVATRMSLSFPLLFCAVPLYAQDFTFASKAEQDRWRKNLFSDGGLSNNFPIQFFDRMLPNSPTFGISLDDFNEKRVPEDVRKQYPQDDDPHRASGCRKPRAPEAACSIPGEPLNGIVAFFSRLIDAAKDWQDNLQSTLPGYRDRIVHVGLKSDEGGLNITMPPKLVLALGDYGAQAGVDMRDEFDLDEHRWRRFLVAMDRMDHTLDEIAAAYNGQGGIESFAAFLDRYPNPPNPVSYKDAARDHLETLKTRVADLAELSRRWEAQLQIPDDGIAASQNRPADHAAAVIVVSVARVTIRSAECPTSTRPECILQASSALTCRRSTTTTSISIQRRSHQTTRTMALARATAGGSLRAPAYGGFAAARSPRRRGTATLQRPARETLSSGCR